MLLHFHAHRWKGACGPGNEVKAHMHTRVAGGMRVWENGIDEMNDDHTPGTTPGPSKPASPGPSPMHSPSKEKRRSRSTSPPK